MKRQHAYQLRNMMHKAAASLPDEDAVEAVELFAEWQVGVLYPAGQRVRRGEKLYRCEQAHMSQEGWEPEKTPALWTEVAAPGEIPVWKQPTGAQDSYMTGDKVHYPTKTDPVYVSTVDNNVWEPGVYGWVLEE